MTKKHVISLLEKVTSRRAVFTVLMWFFIPLPSGFFPGQSGLIEQPFSLGIGPYSIGYSLMILIYFSYSMISSGALPSTVQGGLTTAIFSLIEYVLIGLGTLLAAYLLAVRLDKEVEEIAIHKWLDRLR